MGMQVLEAPVVPVHQLADAEAVSQARAFHCPHIGTLRAWLLQPVMLASEFQQLF
jgi:hypothetical protein